MSMIMKLVNMGQVIDKMVHKLEEKEVKTEVENQQDQASFLSYVA